MRGGSWFAGLALVGIALLGSTAPALGAAAVGQPAPELVLPLLNGQVFDLSSLKGKVVLVNYWATWCPPCRAEMPALNAIYTKYHAQGLELLGLSADRARDRKKVEKVMEGFGYPAALLSEAKTNEFGPARILPVTYVIDAAGVVRGVLMGSDNKPMSEDLIEQAIVPLLPEPKASPQ